MNFNASLESGIWSPINEPFSREISESIETNPQKRFKTIEANFVHYIDESMYMNHTTSSEVAAALGEMCLCTATIYMIMGKFDKAMETARTGWKCARYTHSMFYESLMRLVGGYLMLL